jgi:mono/diheme cytochrome c family protein
MVLMRRCLLFMSTAAALLACGNASVGDAEAPPPTEGEMVFNTNCAMCHGRKGDLGISGAKDLVASTLSRDSVIAMVTNGKGAMMPYGKTLSKKQIEAVADHVLTLRTAPASK